MEGHQISHPARARRANAGGNAGQRQRFLPRFRLAVVPVVAPLRPGRRFVSGYLIQLKADVKSLEAPAGRKRISPICTPGAKSICPGAAGSGSTRLRACWPAKATFPWPPPPIPRAPRRSPGASMNANANSVEMNVTRIFESPRVTKPYSEEQWDGDGIARPRGRCRSEKRRLPADDGRRTNVCFQRRSRRRGMEFHRRLAQETQFGRRTDKRLRKKFAPGSLLHYGQGKWYPGESLPRWASPLLAQGRRADLEGRFAYRARIQKLRPRREGGEGIFSRISSWARRSETPDSGLRRRVLLPVEGTPLSVERHSGKDQSQGQAGARAHRPDLSAGAGPGGGLCAAH